MNKHSVYRLLAFWLLCWTSLFASTSFALSTGWLETPQQPEARVRLLLSGEKDTNNGTVQAALEVVLSGDWKTYWRSPGDAGIPATVDWKINEPGGSENLAKVEWLWPVPERIELLGLHTLGYKNGAVFPLILKIEDINKPVSIRARLRLSSCTTLCVLTDYDIKLDFIPSLLQVNPEAAFIVNKALSKVPGYMAATGLSVKNSVWDLQSNRLVVNAFSDSGWVRDVDVIVDGQEDITFGVPELHRKGNELQAIFNTSSWLEGYDLKNKPINVTLVNGLNAKEEVVAAQQGAVTVGVVTAKDIVEPRVNATSSGLLVILGMAFLGGLILNLMPCVLPVLGIKLSSVLNSSGQEDKQTRKQFISSAAGIVFSFWLLAAFLLSLKLAGNSIGWGIQFQNPWFIGFMVVVTGVFTANLLGMFEVNLPSSFSSRIAATGDESTKGYFIQGMFATLLATPCSAPFLGTAVAFALSGSAFELFTVFSVMGLGLAAPYYLIAAKPSMLSFLPKPGQWMIKLRYVLALMLLLTMLWLMSLLQVYIEARWVWGLSFLLTALFVHHLLTVLLHGRSKKALIIPALCCSSLLVMSVFWFTGGIDRKPIQDNLTWKVLDEQHIETLVAEGKTVFVDVTADWCVTCKANKVRVINRNPVNQSLQAENIVTMKGDWTLPSEKINGYLQKYGRFGVPFNIVYGPSAPKGITLPVVLDHDAVLNALEKAGQ